MRVDIIDVKAGACAFITTDDGRTLMIDCGNNVEEQWEPGGYLKAIGVREVDLLFITNYDEDHLRGYPSLAANQINVRRIHRNKSLAPHQILDLKDEDVGPGAGLKQFVADLQSKFTAEGDSPTYSNFGFSIFYNTPSQVGMNSNDLSMLVQARCNGWNILFTGDLEIGGWEKLDQRITPELKQTHILMAPHHGRENGLWEGFRTRCNDLSAVVISDKGYMYDTQKAAVPFYRQLAKGLLFGRPSEKRYVLTTRNDGSITMDIDAHQVLRCHSFDESSR